MKFNRFLTATDEPPVPEAASWIAGREFPAHLPLLDLSQAVPDYPTAPQIREHLAEQLQSPDIGRYGSVLGLQALRDAYAEKVSTDYRSRHVSGDQVAITAGCNQAFYIAASALLEPGDEVILPVPWYFNHKMTLDMLGARCLPLTGGDSQNLQPRADAARALIGPRTRAIALISPNNPTGHIYSPACLQAFYDLCKETGIALIIDETYTDFRPTAQTPAHPLFTDPDWPQTLIHLYSFSKAYALAGYRVGALLAGTPLLTQINKLLDCVTICATVLSQHAALYGLRHAGQWQSDKRDMMSARSQRFRLAMSTNPGDYRIAAMGSYFAYLQHPHRQPARVVARALADQINLLTLPGEMFGPDQDRYLRVAFANIETAQMDEIASRLTLPVQL